MSRSGYLEETVWVEEKQSPWSPTVRLILAFVLGMLALSPALLGIYWERLLLY